MANDLNLCQFIGRLGADVELKYMPSGEAVANISIAVGSSWKDKNTGEKRENTEWIKCDAFGKLAEIMSQYLHKGSQIYVSGSWRTRKWTDQGGTDHYTTSLRVSNMQMLGGPDGAPAAGTTGPVSGAAPTAAPAGTARAAEASGTASAASTGTAAGVR